MLSPLDSIWTILAFCSITAAAIGDIRRMEINPFYYKFAFICLLIAAAQENLVYTVASTGLCWLACGIMIYYLDIWGGGDAKLMLPVGAFFAYLNIHFLVYLPFFIFSSLCLSTLYSIYLGLKYGNVSGSVPFAPTFPVSIVITYLFLKNVGF